MNACQTCKHFAALNGQCRAKSPTVVLIGIDANGKAVFAGTWAPTQPGNWCAEWQPEIANG